MRNITLDASEWKSCVDFYDAVLEKLGSPSWHGRNMNALIDSMVYGGINKVQPPYRLKIINMSGLSNDVFEEIMRARRGILDARADFQAQNGNDVKVDIDPDGAPSIHITN